MRWEFGCNGIWRGHWDFLFEQDISGWQVVDQYFVVVEDQQ